MADGLILTEEENNFIGDLQLFLIADRPDEAFHICTKYAPDCIISSGYSGIGGVSLSAAASSIYSGAQRNLDGLVNRRNLLNPVDPSSYRLGGETSTEYRARNQENNFAWSVESTDKTRKNGTLDTLQVNEINGTDDSELDFYSELDLLNGSDYYDSLNLNEEVLRAETKNASTSPTGNYSTIIDKNCFFF